MDDFYYTYKPHNDNQYTDSEEKKLNTEIHPGISECEDGFTINTQYAESINEVPQHEKKPSVTEQVFEWLDVLVTSIIAVVIIFTLLFRVATIKGSSMENTLFTNNKVIISNLGYTPKQGDIVVISRNIDNSVESEVFSDEPIIKRVIAVGGQMVDIDFERGVVSVDGVELKEDYTKTLTTRKHDVEFPVYVPEGSIFVLGDNRNDSMDSRFSCIGNNGMVDTRYVLGHAVYRVFPFNQIGRLNK